MFLVNSRSRRFSAAPSSSVGKPPHHHGHSFFRRYGVILPNSLTRVLSRALGFSPSPPVSVCGTVTTQLPRGFSWQHGVSDFSTVMADRHHLSGLMTDGFAYLSPYGLTRESNNADHLASCVTPLVKRFAVAREYEPVVHPLRLSPSG